MRGKVGFVRRDSRKNSLIDSRISYREARVDRILGDVDVKGEYSPLPTSLPEDPGFVRVINDVVQVKALSKEVEDQYAPLPNLPEAACETKLCRPSKWILLPADSKKMECWVALLCVAILITAFWTPYQVAFGRHNVLTFDLHFVVERVLDAIFLMDICLQFFVAYPEEQHRTVRWIKNPGRIARNYLGGWFVTHLLCALPWDIIFSYSAGFCIGLPGRCSSRMSLADAERLKGIYSLRILRLMRLIRLTWMLRLSQIMIRWHCRVGVQYAHLSLIKFIFLTCLASHWMCCFWGGLAQSGDFLARMNLGDGNTWLTLLQDRSLREKELNGQDTSGLRPFASGPEQYAVSLYWAVATLTSIGYGDIVPTNALEYGACIMIMAVGSSIWAYVIGGICGVLSSMDPHTISFKQSMDDLNAMMSIHDLPQDMRRRLRLYMHESRNLRQRKAGQILKTDLSPSLRGELEMQCNSEWMHNVFYLSELPSEVVAEVSKALQNFLFAPGELIGEEPKDVLDPSLYIVQRGIVGRNGRVLGWGSVFGEDMILHTSELRDKSTARAMSFVEVCSLSRSALEDIRNMYPDACQQIRRLQIQMALRRKLIMIAKHVLAQVKGNAQISTPLCSPSSPTRARGSSRSTSWGSDVTSLSPSLRNSPSRLDPSDRNPALHQQNSVMDRLEKMEENMKAFFDSRFCQLEHRISNLESSAQMINSKRIMGA